MVKENDPPSDHTVATLTCTSRSLWETKSFIPQLSPSLLGTVN
jgi:hypothetical protein